MTTAATIPSAPSAAPAQATAAPTPATNPAAPASAPAAVASPTTPQQTTEPGQVTSPQSAATPVVGATPTVAAPAADPREEINQLAIQHGYEPYMLAEFQDVATAKAAIRDAALQSISRTRGVNPLAYVPQNAYQAAGGSVFQQPGQQPVVPQQPQPVAPAAPAVVVKPIDLKALGLEDDEPAAKAVRVLEKELAERDAKIGSIEQKFQAIEQQNRAAAQANALAEANSFIDGLKSTKYGVSKTRTPLQQFALNRLIDTADDIAISEYNLTGRVLPVAVRLARAVTAEESATVAPPIPAPATPIAEPLRQTAAPTGPGPAQPWNPNAKWSQNPEILAKAGIRQ